MADGPGGERTEKASPKKREDERKKGNIFISKDVATVFSLTISFFILRFFIPNFMLAVQENYRTQLTRAGYVGTLDIPLAQSLFRELLMLFGTTILPAIVLISFVGVLSYGLQTRFLLSKEPLKFKPERIHPAKGIKKLFSLRSLIELLKSFIKIAALTWILYGNVQGLIADLPGMMDWDITWAFFYTGSRIFALIMSVMVALAIIAAADFLYQRWEYEKSIRMTKQEVKDEYKQLEGNPEIKGARKQKQWEYAVGRMVQTVRDADVVVKSTARFAVALKYNPGSDAAPAVLAKGRDKTAQRITQKADEYKVICIENRSLAKELYESAKIDEVIPARFFAPVAELLAELYSQNKKEER